MDLVSAKLFKSQLEVHVKLLRIKFSKNDMPLVGLILLHFAGNISEITEMIHIIRKASFGHH